MQWLPVGWESDQLDQRRVPETQTRAPLGCETSLREPKDQAAPWAEAQQTVWGGEWDLIEPGLNG